MATKGDASLVDQSVEGTASRAEGSAAMESQNQSDGKRLNGSALGRRGLRLSICFRVSMATRSTPRLLTTKNSWSTSESIDLLNAVKGHLAQHPSDAFDFIYKDDAISALYCARSIPRSIGEIAVHLTQIKTDMVRTLRMSWT